LHGANEPTNVIASPESGLLGGATLLTAPTVWAQAPGRIYRIGIIAVVPPALLARADEVIE
jgi:hypothetical protein